MLSCILLCAVQVFVFWMGAKIIIFALSVYLFFVLGNDKKEHSIICIYSTSFIKMNAAYRMQSMSLYIKIFYFVKLAEILVPDAYKENKIKIAKYT